MHIILIVITHRLIHVASHTITLWTSIHYSMHAPYINIQCTIRYTYMELQYALLIRANKPKTAVQSSTSFFSWHQHGLIPSWYVRTCMIHQNTMHNTLQVHYSGPVKEPIHGFLIELSFLAVFTLLAWRAYIFPMRG